MIHGLFQIIVFSKWGLSNLPLPCLENGFDCALGSHHRIISTQQASARTQTPHCQLPTTWISIIVFTLLSTYLFHTWNTVSQSLGKELLASPQTFEAAGTRTT
jgi:hypothetical protein